MRKAEVSMAEVESKQKRFSIKKSGWIVIAIAGLCAAVWTGWGIHKYWNDPKLVNFLAAWIPTVGSIVIAFVPEGQMTPIKKWVWRSAVVGMGFAWSVILWHQQVVMEEANASDQKAIVAAAVNKSNQHADEKIGEVQHDVQGVKTDVGGVKSALKETADALSSMVSKSEKSITSGLAKVGKPEPPELAKVQFSLFPEESQINNLPILARSINQDKDGNIPVDVTFTNVSSTSADLVEIWITVCSICSFAVEPTGFDKPKGSDERMRHRQLPGLLNPGVTFEKTTIVVKPPLAMSPPYTFELSFTYSCKTCGKQLPKQSVRVSVLPYAAASSL